MNDMCDKAISQWYWKRQLFFIVGATYQGYSCVEYAAVSISTLQYYKNIIKVDNPRFYYGVCMSNIFLSAIISSKLFGIYMDKTRNVKMCSMLLLFSTIGNILYSLPYSKWLPIIGRFLCGLNGGLKVAIVGKDIL